MGGSARGNGAGRASGFRLGQVRGIEIRIDWSLALIFFLITFNLGAGLFPRQHPEWGPVGWWALALAAAVLFFASVLAHELAHAFVGRAQGMRVEGITLFIFGGMAHVSEEPRSARAEFLMAAVGPLTSLAIGLVSVLAGLALGGLGSDAADSQHGLARRLGPVATLLMWLGPINVLLGIFNLLPGFPLDGGRVLRAALWKATGDMEKATRWASTAGRAIALGLVFAGAMMVFGIRVPLFGRGLMPGLWLVFIGWFLNNAAVQGYHQVVIRELLRDVPVGRLMRPEALVVSPELPVGLFVDRYLMNSDQRCCAVVSGDRFLGLVCLADVHKVPRSEWGRRTVGEIMTSAESLAVVRPDEDVANALRQLTAGDVDQVPVVEEGHLRGILRRADILRWVELQGAGA